MTVSYNQAAYNTPNANYYQKTQPKKKSSVGKSALIGACVTTSIGGIGAGSIALIQYGMSKTLKGQSIKEKREFLKELMEKEKNNGKRIKCYSKSLRDTMKQFKNPLLWAAIVGVGAAIGALIGFGKNAN